MGTVKKKAKATIRELASDVMECAVLIALTAVGIMVMTAETAIDLILGDR